VVLRNMMDIHKFCFQKLLEKIKQQAQQKSTPWRKGDASRRWPAAFVTDSHGGNMIGARNAILLFATCALAATAACTADRDPVGIEPTARLALTKLGESVQFGTSADDAAFDIAAGKLGVAVVGTTLGAFDGETNAGARDAFVRLFDARGVHLWTQQFGTGVDDAAFAVAMDKAGIYVAGTSFGSLGPTNIGESDGYVRMLDASGNLVWSTRLASAGADSAFGLTVDNGALYVTGVLRGSMEGAAADNANGYVTKIDARTGAIQWTTYFIGVAGGDDGARGVTVAGDAVYVAATYYGGTLGLGPGAEDAYIVRLNSTTGAITWMTTIATAGIDIGWDVAVDGRTAFLVGASGFNAFATAVNAATGAIQWTTTLLTPGVEIATTVDAGHSMLHVGGWTSGAFPGMSNAGLSDMFHAKLDATTGAVQTVNQLGSSGQDAPFGSFLDGKTWNMVGATSGSFAGASLGGFDAWWMPFDAR
jgi:outer membrane protein assembly factor BamB